MTSWRRQDMDLRKKSANCVVLSLLFYFVCIGNPTLHAATVEDKLWSFEFNNLTASDILSKISKVSGIEIVLNGETDKKPITKLYKDYTIDNILLDIFSGENLAALFSYYKQELTSVYIWILPEGGSITPEMLRQIPATSSGLILKTPQSQQEHKKMKESITHSEINKTVTAKDTKKVSEDTGSKNSYFVVFKGNSKTEGNGNNSYSEIGMEEDNSSAIVDVPPAFDPEKFGGLEPPPIPPGIILF